MTGPSPYLIDARNAAGGGDVQRALAWAAIAQAEAFERMAAAMERMEQRP